MEEATTLTSHTQEASRMDAIKFIKTSPTTRRSDTSQGVYKIIKMDGTFFAIYTRGQDGHQTWIQHKGTLKSAIEKCNRHNRSLNNGTAFGGIGY
jgi:hypothetical protein